jgi:hypothetical protein
MEQIIDRFEKHIDTTGECWLWTGYLSKGYGLFSYDKDKKMMLVHRFAYLLSYGELPPSPLVVRHKCRSRNCVNPNHLESGTASQNMRDKIRDGTEQTGEINGRAILTWQQVREIRKRQENSAILAKEYGVSHATILKIRKGITWKE